MDAIVLVVLVAGALIGWTAVLRRYRMGQPVLPREPRRDVPWGLVDVFIVFLLWISANGLASSAVLQWHGITLAPDMKIDPEVKLRMMFYGPAAGLIGLVVAVAFVTWKNEAREADFGLRLRVLGDLALGAAVFILLAGPVYAIQGALVQFWPSEHPVTDFVLKNPSAKYFAVSAFSAVLIAPIVEEFVFRVMLQGWLERLRAKDNNPISLLAGRLPGVPFDSGQDSPPTTQNEETKVGKEEKPEHSNEVKAEPIVISAILFALVHYSHGPDWVALTFFAIGLGFLYQRTHRVLPCIVVHMLLNALSLGMLAVAAFSGEQPPT